MEDRQAGGRKGRQAGGKAGRREDRQAGGRTGRQAGGQAGTTGREARRQVCRQTGRHKRVNDSDDKRTGSRNEFETESDIQFCILIKGIERRAGGSV